VVAALESTLGPTTVLLEESATALGVQVEIEHLWVHDAWPLFLKGDHAAFIEAVVTAVQAAHRSPEHVIVLAQASMARAEIGLKSLGIETLSSPRLGVENLVARLQQQQGHTVLIRDEIIGEWFQQRVSVQSTDGFSGNFSELEHQRHVMCR